MCVCVCGEVHASERDVCVATVDIARGVRWFNELTCLTDFCPSQVTWHTFDG